MPDGFSSPVIAEDAIQLADRYGAPIYHPLPVVIAEAEGAWVWDTQGRRYLDCLAAYSAVNQGHRHPRIIAALIEQAGRVTLTSRAFHNDRMGRFLERLTSVTETEMAVPMNTGAEAIETAIKAVRRWGYQIKGVPDNRAEIIVCSENFHGRTTTVISASSEAAYKHQFGPFTPGFRLVPYGDVAALEQAITTNTVAVIMEPIQGEGGIIIPPDGYLSAIRRVCRENSVLFVLDEIQTGLGRTGRIFCYQHEADAKPDLLIVGKALGGGVYPVSAVLGPRAILGLFRPGEHGSTFGGNPLGAAVAEASLAVTVDEDLPGRSARLGALLLDRLRMFQSSAIREIRGRGLFIGIEIDRAAGPARPYCKRLMDLGVLCKETHEQVIRLAPPLTIADPEIEFLIDQLKTVFGER